MREDSNYNDRQYEMMLKEIELYLKGQLALGKLVDTLDALIRSLEAISDQWRNELVEKWFPLEEVYSVILDEKRDPSEKDERIIVKSLTELKDTLEKRSARAGSFVN